MAAHGFSLVGLDCGGALADLPSCGGAPADAWTAEDATIMDALFMAPRPPARAPAWQDPVSTEWYDTLSGIYK